MNRLPIALRCMTLLTFLAGTAFGTSVLVGDAAYSPYEFRASTFTPSAQSEAAIEVGPTGIVTVVWSSRRQQGGQYGIYAQRFDGNGVAIGEETVVNLWTKSHQMVPDVAGSADGSSWIVWQSHGQDGHAGAIIARHFDPEFHGGSEILVNQQTRGHQVDPIVATGARGESVFVWTSFESAKSSPTLRARRFDASGTPIGGEFAVRAAQAGGACVPAAAFAPDGNFTIAYSVFDAANRPAGIRMQRFGADGSRLGSEIEVSGSRKASQIEPVIAATRDGYIVCWLDGESDGDDYGVLGRRFDRAGKPLGEPFVVNTTRKGPQNAAAIAVARDGRIAIAWTSDDGDDSGIFAQLFEPDGRRIGSEFRINRHTPGKQKLREAAGSHRLAFGRGDELLCAWDGDAGLGDKSSVNVTLLTPRPLELAGRTQGVTDVMKPAAPMAASAGAPEPHRPPTFDPADIGKGDREVLRGEDGQFGFTGILSTGWTPPDPHLAVGPDHVVVMTNGAIAAYTKDGTQLFQDEIEDSYGFWGEVGATSFVFDPEVLYDTTSGRFFAMAAEAYVGGRSYVLIAVSDDSDPEGTWHKFRFETSALAGDLFDSPNIAVDQDALYITGDGFGLGAVYPIYIIDKASLLVGDPPAVFNSLTLSTTTQSAGIPPVTDGTGLLYMVEHGEETTNTAVRLIALRNGLGSPAISTTMVTVPEYTHPEDPPQLGSSRRPETFDARFWSAAYRNGSLWAAHHVNSSRVRARWYEIAMNGWPLSGESPELVQSGEIDPGDDIRTTFCSITVDDAGNAAMTFARSSPSEYISMGSAYRLWCDPLGEFRTDVTEKESTAPSGTRWGDYSAVNPDPAAPRTFWAHHEYQNGSWATWVARVIVDPCDIPGDLDGDGDVDLGDLAILLASYELDAGGDIDGDGDTDLADLAILLANYGQ